MAIDREKFEQGLALMVESMGEPDLTKALFVVVSDGEEVKRTMIGSPVEIGFMLTMEAQACVAEIGQLSRVDHAYRQAFRTARSRLQGSERLGGADGQREQGTGGADTPAP